MGKRRKEPAPTRPRVHVRKVLSRTDWLVVAWLAGQLATLALLVWLVVLTSHDNRPGALAPTPTPTFSEEQQ